MRLTHGSLNWVQGVAKGSRDDYWASWRMQAGCIFFCFSLSLMLYLLQSVDLFACSLDYFMLLICLSLVSPLTYDIHLFCRQVNHYHLCYLLFGCLAMCHKRWLALLFPHNIFPAIDILCNKVRIKKICVCNPWVLFSCLSRCFCHKINGFVVFLGTSFRRLI